MRPDTRGGRRRCRRSVARRSATAAACAGVPTRERSRLTACARSARRTRVRGWKVWFANGFDDAGAGDGHDPRLRPVPAHVGDDQGLARPHREHQIAQPHADERREIAARDLRRRVDGAILLRQLRELRAGDERVAPRLDRFVRLQPERVVVRGQRPLLIAARLRAARQSGPATTASLGIERHGLAKVPSAASEAPARRSTAPSSR